MLKVECESCKAPYQVDERRVPPTGLKMRCPKCGHTFIVRDPSKEGAAGAAPAPAKNLKQTMVGVGGSGGPKPAAAPPPPAAKPPPAAPPAAPKPTPPALDLGDGLDDALGLPAVAAPRPGGARPHAAAPRPAPKPPQVGPADLPGLDDLDLPALAGDVGLPARAAKPAPAAAPKPPPPSTSGAFNFEVDLPSVAPGPGRAGAKSGFGDLPSPKGTVDLPSPKAFGDVDLPTTKGFGDLPTAKGFGDLPTTKGFGDLPASKHGGFADLPIVQNNLPTVGGSTAGGGAGFGEIDLPSLQNDLPQAMGAQAHMPVPVSDDRLMPNRIAPPPDTSAASPIAFGELDLPTVGGPGLPAALEAGPSRAAGPGFGELDLPGGIGDVPAPPASASAPGGMGFGEVDLGGGDLPGAPLGPPPATSAGTFAFEEASLEGAPGPQGATQGTRARPAPEARRSSKAPKVLAGLAVLVVIGGAALQLTPLGAFGHVYLTDKFNATERARAAQAAAEAARAKLSLDTYASARTAADELVELRRKTPRSRSLSTYAAFVEFANQTRFGTDAERAAKVKTFTTDIPADADVPYLAAKAAAEYAAAGDLAKAKAALATASAKEPKDGIQLDLAILRGEVALLERDYATALAAYTEASKFTESARSSFGLARTYYAQKDLAKAKEAAGATLAASPSHAGARTLLALITWDLDRDDVAAMKELAPVLDPAARSTEGPSEISSALAAKGWIMLARDRAGEARAAFDDAVKTDPRNVSALVGQGEVLYADSRFTEALTRFDEALNKDPTGITPTVGVAKTKIALERLADAKALLTAAHERAPKEMSVALWLARVEEALGNVQVAEKLYGDAVDLADPQNPDAIDAYSAAAAFLASQGRVADAQARLEQARAKLPDTPTLQRAFGDVAAAQGQWAEAIARYDAALQKNPTDLGTRFRLGVAYRKTLRLEEAAKEFNDIAAIDREYPGIALERGVVFEASGDIQKALEQFESAYAKAPDDVDLMLRVGAAYVAVGEIDKALPLLEKVKDKRPNSAEANHFIGRAHLRQGGMESAAAMRFLQRAVELDPNRAEYHLYVAWAANEAVPAQLGLARVHVEKALSLDRQLADGYWQRGVVSLREGRIADAVKDLKKALELKPSRFEAHATLAECYGQRNETQAAMAEWSKAIAGSSKVASWRFQYGQLLLERNQVAEAAGHLSFALAEGKKEQPRPGWIARAAFAAGEALRRTNQKQPAIDAYTLFMELSPTTDPDRRDAVKALAALGAPYDG